MTYDLAPTTAGAAVRIDGQQAHVMAEYVRDGDLSQMPEEVRYNYYLALCKTTGLNPATRPFRFIELYNPKLRRNALTLYMTRDGAEQLRALHGVDVVDVEQSVIDLGATRLIRVQVAVQTPDGRRDCAVGLVPLAGLRRKKGGVLEQFDLTDDKTAAEELANAIMKAETKAKRRATLSICGLGWLQPAGPARGVPMPKAAIAPPETDTREYIRGGKYDGTPWCKVDDTAYLEAIVAHAKSPEHVRALAQARLAELAGQDDAGAQQLLHRQGIYFERLVEAHGGDLDDAHAWAVASLVGREPAGVGADDLATLLRACFHPDLDVLKAALVERAKNMEAPVGPETCGPRTDDGGGGGDSHGAPPADGGGDPPVSASKEFPPPRDPGDGETAWSSEDRS